MLDVHVIKNPIDIHEALAFEQVLFSVCVRKHLERMQEQKSKKTRNKNDYTIIFWRAFDAVVCGRNQLPWLECNFEFIKNNNITFARRDSGGGTVYHDEGNLNICVISNADTFYKKNDAKSNLQILVKALKEYHNVNAHLTSHNDIFIDNKTKKISGSAMRVVRGHTMHHFTVLLQADLFRIKKALKISNDLTINSVAVPSRTHAVANVHCATQLIIDSYVKQFENRHKETAEVSKYSNALQAVKQIKEQKKYEEEVKRLTSDAWLYERTPSYSVFVPIPKENITVEVFFVNAKITQIRADRTNNGNFMYMEPLTDIYFTEQSLINACTKVGEHDMIKKVVRILCHTYYKTQDVLLKEKIEEEV